jgi:Mlc titration factor MtfA (ptsG expression regulator)
MPFKYWRRRRLRSRPIPQAWRDILERKLPYYRCLPPEDRRELEGHIQVFLAEKYFEGCAGLKITDEIRVLIAAQACILLLHRDTDYYPGLRTVLVYPESYLAHDRAVGPAGVVTEGPVWRRGESWHTPGAGGPVVLSWRDVQASAADIHDGFNVVFHEFAHQLDGESGAVEGAPALERRSQYIAWARVLEREYRSLIDDLRNNRPTLLSAYGATSPAEFFAVLTEAFFERPRELKWRHPELYQQLASFYKQDPATLRGCFEGGPGALASPAA